MFTFIIAIATVIVIVIGVIWALYFFRKKKWKKFNRIVLLLTFIFSIIPTIIALIDSINLPDLAPFDNNDNVYINSTIYAYPKSFITIRYTLGHL